MTLALDGASDARESTCNHCGESHVTVTSFVTEDGAASCVAKTALYDHDGREAWMDVVFGTFGQDVDDHVTFGCRVGAVVGSPDPAATAVDAALPYADSPFWGTKLTHEQALASPDIDRFWEVVDFLLAEEPAINRHVYG